MVDNQRMLLPDSVRTNGASENPWWANAVVYQIYPRSFQDSNGDGVGDLKGITSRLDYFADLGVDVLWLSPVFRSPQDDNGYDISDYQDIDPLFGSLADMDELLVEAHQRGLKVIMDLVVNHTSDEHSWFQASRDKQDTHADWYWWRPAKPGMVPGTPGAEPNRWGSYFGGSAWEFDEMRGEYYLHQFSKKQPDLNWENPEVRGAVFDMMNWWMDRGIDGFRMDVIVLISKQLDEHGMLAGEVGSSISEGPVGEEGYTNPAPMCSDGPRLDEFLVEMRQRVFAHRDGYLTVGEAPGIEPERNRDITDPSHGELDMLFLFDHMGIDQHDSKWDIAPFEVAKLRCVMQKQQDAVRCRGWASLFFNNHDQPRVVSRWGDTSSEELRTRSAKALGLVLHLHRGTPYIYQGEELGMTNAGFTSLGEYRDLESINLYHQRVDEAKVQSAGSMLGSLQAKSRDNARTPMQWDSSRFAGFMDARVSAEPWIAVNDNHNVVNADVERGDSNSVLAFYRRLIRLRHENAVVAAGVWDVIDTEDERVYAFTRSIDCVEDRSHKHADSPDGFGSLCGTLLVVVNLSSQDVEIPSQSAGLLAQFNDFTSVENKIILSTYSVEHSAHSAQAGLLSPWEGFICRIAETWTRG